MHASSTTPAQHQRRPLMPHVLRSTLVVLGILFGGWTYATPFTVELTVPSHSVLPDVVYATVRGEVDPADNTVMHFSIELNPELSTLLHGGDNFGIAGFWFNSDLLLSPAMFKNFTPAATWAITASNPNCPGGCSASGSGFGEFNMRLMWSGAPADRPEHLAFAIDFGSAVTEGNFNLLSVEKAPGSTHLGHFVLFLDGFDTTMGGVRIRGTFVKDVAVPGCHIGGVFYTSGAVNATQCQSCQPTVSTTAWTNLAASTSCNDHSGCTTGDHCDGAGSCTGTAVLCTASDQCHAPACTSTGDTTFTCSNLVAPDGTTCEAGNPCTDDTCESGTCTTGEINHTSCRTIFVTSAEYSGNLGGLSGADALCATRATQAPDPLPGTFKAWLSDSTTSAASRLTHPTVPIMLVDGTVIATDWDDLTDDTLNAPIDLDETGTLVSAFVWTGTAANGDIHIATGNCANWTTASASFLGQGGHSTIFRSFQWTEVANSRCDFSERLYCIEQDPSP